MLNTPLSIYIHWPFCLSKCPYCDFNSHVRESISVQKWQDAYLKELDFYHQKTKNRLIKTIFFGGGTPSLMPPALVEAVIHHIKTLWSTDPKLEITLEANPNSIEVEKFAALKQAGINRVSVGIQSLIPEDLKFLGRNHSVDEAQKAIETAKSTFDNFSFDLIYLRPNQSLKAWEAELKTALAFNSPHLSLYQLTIEQGTAFYTQFNRGDFTLPDDDRAADFYDLTQKIMGEAGLPAYEVSNHARPGHECRHNLAYWHYQDYLGIGPGAHGRLTLEHEGKLIKTATHTHKAPELYLDLVDKNQNGQKDCLTLTPDEIRSEFFMMGLRLTSGIQLSDYQTLSQIYDLTPLDPAKVKQLCDAGFLSLTPTDLIPIPRLNQTNGFQSEPPAAYSSYVRTGESRKIRLDHLKMGFGIKATPRGLLVLNSLLGHLLSA